MLGNTVSFSSTEAEIVTLFEAIEVAIWIKNVMYDINRGYETEIKDIRE